MKKRGSVKGGSLLSAMGMDGTNARCEMTCLSHQGLFSDISEIYCSLKSLYRERGFITVELTLEMAVPV